MSTVAEQAAPTVDQLPLITQPAPEAIRVSVWGRLTRQAEVRVATDGSRMLIVQILQHKGGLPFVAIRHVRADEMPSLHEMADKLKPGVAIVIVGIGLEVATHQGQQVLSPRICEAIHLAPFSFINDDGSIA
jgi:hypothetical protein